LEENKIIDGCKFLNNKIIPSLFVFPNDMSEINTEINHFSNQKLVEYYLKSANNWRQ